MTNNWVKKNTISNKYQIECNKKCVHLLHIVSISWRLCLHSICENGIDQCGKFHYCVTISQFPTVFGIWAAAHLEFMCNTKIQMLKLICIFQMNTSSSVLQQKSISNRNNVELFTLSQGRPEKNTFGF